MQIYLIKGAEKLGCKLPSIRSFINGVLNRFSRVSFGFTLSDKVNIFVTSTLQSTPRVIRRNVSLVDKMMRRLVDILCSNTIIKVGFVKYNLLDEESFQILLPDFESFMQLWFKPSLMDVFVDVGAHLGKYALIAAKHVGVSGLIIAVEPHPVNYQVLLKNVALNNFRNVVALNLAAWKTNCELKLFIGNVAGHHSVKLNQGLGWVKVKGKAMDNVLGELPLNRLDWIKIDVEGVEYEALLGLEKAIQRYRPKILIEVFHENMARVKKFMKKNNYELIKISPSLKENTYFFCTPLIN